MSDGRRLRRGRPLWTVSLGLALLAIVCLLTVGPPADGTYPVLSDGVWSTFLGNLNGPTLTPGGSGTVSFRVGNPLPAPLSGVTVHLEVYAFNPTDGGAVQTPPPVASPELGSGGTSANATQGLVPTKGTWSDSVPVAVPMSGSAGDFAVRFSVSFTVNGTGYLLESRGFFSTSEWGNATRYANGTPTINASRLGVSGVVPETSILVRTPSPAVALYVVLGVGLGLAALGAYWWARSDANSRSGARRSSPSQRALTALGSSRRRDGD